MTTQSDKNITAFTHIYGAPPAYKVSAAGRVNIIGEHIDYCGGKVLPAALSLKNIVYVRPNGTNKINLSWTTLPDKVSLDINNLENYRSLKYGNYQAGCALEWLKAGHKVVGCDMYQDCTVPFGSGLSSSAAIEVSTIVALAAVAGENIKPIEIAVCAQRVEHNFIGVNCGIMDQYASACGKKGMAMLLDCSTLDCEYLPVRLGCYSLVIANCNKPHNLVESQYNQRRAETEEALKKLQGRINVDSLSQITPGQFRRWGLILPKKLRKRAAHVVGECERVRLAALALKAGNMEMLGRLLNNSHASLRDNFEVTGEEPDALVEAAQSYPACVGSRLTGAGFGGCTISLVRSQAVDDFKESVYRRYYERTGYRADFYSVDISDGLTVTKLQEE